jgi:hypothetical protein
VSLWVCADRGVDPMFGATGADIRRGDRKTKKRPNGRSNGRRH